MSKKILIIGNSAKEYSLAKLLSEKNEVFVAPGNDSIGEFATIVDIREDAVVELLEFAVENGIDMTIPVSLKSLKTSIVEDFSKNGQQILAPSCEAVNAIFDKMSIKKILYKLRIPTPRFAIFEKQNMAVDYVKNLKNPYVVKSNEPSSSVVLTKQCLSSKGVLDSYFVNKSQKVLIEDYVWGTPFSFYVLTDGYKALPIGSSIVYKHSLEGNGGQLTSGMGSCVPNYKLSLDNEYYIMEEVVYPILEYLQAGATPYLGVLGVSGVLTEEGQVQVLGLEPFMQDCDAMANLYLIDADLLSLFEACSVGSFSDEISYIPLKELSGTSVVLNCKNGEQGENVIVGLDNLDEDVTISYFPQAKKNRYLEYEANKGSVMVVTAFSRTLTSSTEKVYSELECIEFKGKSYRKDIGAPLLASV